MSNTNLQLPDYRVQFSVFIFGWINSMFRIPKIFCQLFSVLSLDAELPIHFCIIFGSIFVQSFCTGFGWKVFEWSTVIVKLKI